MPPAPALPMPTDTQENMMTTHTHISHNPLLVAAFWFYVGIPLAWGVWSTLQKAMALFN